AIPVSVRRAALHRLGRRDTVRGNRRVLRLVTATERIALSKRLANGATAMHTRLRLAGLLLLGLAFPQNLTAQPPAGRELRVRPTDDFAVTGDGSAEAWKKTEWEPLHKRTTGGPAYETKFKVPYSKTGFYT